MYKPKNIVLAVLLIVLIIVLAQNSESESVDFLFWSFSASKFVVYILFFVAGVLSTLLMNIWRKI